MNGLLNRPHPLGGTAGALARYRVMAFIVGTGLALLCFVGIPLQVIGGNKWPWTAVVAIVGPIHGIFYIVYLVDLSGPRRPGPVSHDAAARNGLLWPGAASRVLHGTEGHRAGACPAGLGRRCASGTGGHGLVGPVGKGEKASSITSRSKWGRRTRRCRR